MFDDLFNDKAQKLLNCLRSSSKADLIFNANYRLYRIGENDDKAMKCFKENANRAIQGRIDDQRSLKELYEQIEKDLAIALFSPNDHIREIAKIIKMRSRDV